MFLELFLAPRSRKEPAIIGEFFDLDEVGTFQLCLLKNHAQPSIRLLVKEMIHGFTGLEVVHILNPFEAFVQQILLAQTRQHLQPYAI